MRKLSILIFIAYIFLLTVFTKVEAAFPVSKETKLCYVDSSQEEAAPAHYLISEKKLKAAAEKEGKTGQKTRSKLAAFLLCILLGLMGIHGIHRIYLGHIWQGIVQLLTFGGCCIWWIIDIIRLSTGDLQPKNAVYEDDF